MHSSFCEIVHGLEVHPKFGTGVIEARQAQSCICRYGPLALDDSVHARCRNPQSDRQSINGHSQWFKKFLVQHFAGMGGRFGVAIALVVVDDFDIGRSFFGPCEARRGISLGTHFFGRCSFRTGPSLFPTVAARLCRRSRYLFMGAAVESERNAHTAALVVAVEVLLLRRGWQSC